MYECVYSTSDYSDMVFLVSISFNKVVDVQFNSTVGEFVGYTEQGVKYAENLNKNKELLQHLKAQVDALCIPNAQNSDSAVRDKTGECYKTLVSSLLHNKDLTMFVHWHRRTPLKMHETEVCCFGGVVSAQCGCLRYTKSIKYILQLDNFTQVLFYKILTLRFFFRTE